MSPAQRLVDHNARVRQRPALSLYITGAAAANAANARATNVTRTTAAAAADADAADAATAVEASSSRIGREKLK